MPVHEEARPAAAAPSGAAVGRAVDLGSGLLAVPVALWSGVPVAIVAAVLLAWPLALLAVRDTAVRRARLRPGSPVRAFACLTAAGAVALAAARGTGLAHPGIERLQDLVVVAVTIASASLATRLVLRAGRRPTRVLVLGGRPATSALLGADRRDARVVGVCDVDARTGRTSTARAWPAELGGGRLGFLEAVRAWQVDLVVVSPSCQLSAEAVRRLTWELEAHGVDLAFPREVRSVARHRVELGEVGGQPMLVVRPSRPGRSVLLVKHLIDRVGAAVLLLAALPLLAVLAVLVRSDSPGPAFFRQTRVGRDGRLFTLLKLRTMCAEAESLQVALVPENEADAVLFKIRRDPRVTGLGRWLRRTSLDELPQLLNVVRGEMSLVGPRPALPHEVAQYDDVARRRLAVRPGITGLWQVNGRSDLDWQRSVDLDVHYTDNITISGDLAICLRTVRAVAGGRGAY
jgi:exopolysaccharide biosynthesis polyprenyl glycosylphosphotransferase